MRMLDFDAATKRVRPVDGPGSVHVRLPPPSWRFRPAVAHLRRGGILIHGVFGHVNGRGWAVMGIPGLQVPAEALADRRLAAREPRPHPRCCRCPCAASRIACCHHCSNTLLAWGDSPAP
jgi:hypothetical protein